MSKKVSKKDLSPEARAIINSQVTRRGLIAGTGAVGAAGLLAACVPTMITSELTLGIRHECYLMWFGF